MFLMHVLFDTYLMSYIVCREFQYINLALSIHASMPALSPTCLFATAWHDLIPNNSVYFGRFPV